jgi:hypothetical protein
MCGSRGHFGRGISECLLQRLSRWSSIGTQIHKRMSSPEADTSIRVSKGGSHRRQGIGPTSHQLRSSQETIERDIIPLSS